MLIELENVTKTYGKVSALRGLSVAVPEGAIGLLGPNGAGKTTMIRTLLGLISLDSGSGRVLGMDIRAHRLAIRQAVGFVPEDECLFPGMTGVASVAYAGELVGMGRRDALQRAHEVLDYVGLGEARYRRIESYSTGMKQRLKIASAIVHDPRLLILDEPTNGMDPAGRDDVLELAVDLARNKGMSLLFSSHLLPDVEAVCEYVMVLGRGRLLVQGRIEDLEAVPSTASSSCGSRATRRRSPGDSRRWASRPSRSTTTSWSRCRRSTAPRALWEAARDAGEQVRAFRPQAEHARGGLPRRPRGETLMPIFDQGYQHWHGRLSGQADAMAADHPAWGPRRSSRTDGSAGSCSAPAGPPLLLVGLPRALGALRAEIRVPDAVPDLPPEPPRGAQGRAARVPHDDLDPGVPPVLRDPAHLPDDPRAPGRARPDQPGPAVQRHPAVPVAAGAAVRILPGQARA